MTITSVITAILIGIVVGVLGRLLVPGKQPIGVLLTILVGIVSAFIGTAIARALGIPTVTDGIDWLELLVQVIVAAFGVALVSSLMGRRRAGRWVVGVPACSADRLHGNPGWNPPPAGIVLRGLSSPKRTFGRKSARRGRQNVDFGGRIQPTAHFVIMTADLT